MLSALETIWNNGRRGGLYTLQHRHILNALSFADNSGKRTLQLINYFTLQCLTCVKIKFGYSVSTKFNILLC